MSMSEDLKKSEMFLDEVLHYCGEKNPIGALFLEGEWGCGKTVINSHFHLVTSLS